MPTTYAEHAKRLRHPAMCELLPIRDFPHKDNVMVRTDGAYVAGFRIMGAQSYFADDPAREAIKFALEALLRTIPEESMRIQFRYEVVQSANAILESYADGRRTENLDARELDENREKHWRQLNERGEYLTRIAAVYLIWDPKKHQKQTEGGLPLSLKRVTTAAEPEKASSFFDTIIGWIKHFLKPIFAPVSQDTQIQRSQTEHLNILAQFESLLTGIQTAMRNVGFEPERMTDEELFLEVKRALNPIAPDTRPISDSLESPRYVSAREQLALVSILGQKENYVNIDGVLWSAITLKLPPDGTKPGLIRDLLIIGFPVVISTQIVVPNQQQVLDSYKKKHKKMVAAQLDVKGNLRTDVAAQVAARELLSMQESIIASSIKTIELSLTILVRTSRVAYTAKEYDFAERQLAIRRQQIMHVVGKMNGARAITESVGQLRIILGALPGCAEKDDRELGLITPHGADLVPVEMPWPGTVRSPLMLFDTPYRQLVPFSPFDPGLENANALVTATSGTGKSVLVGKILAMCGRQEIKVSILERGDSYLPLVEYHGGHMITMSLDSDKCINMFDLDPGETAPSNDKIAFLMNLTRFMIGDKGDGDVDLLDNIIVDCIHRAYVRASRRLKDRDKTPTLSDLRDDLNNYHDENESIVELARIAAKKLSSWVDNGPYANLFDRLTTVNMQTPWLYFNVEKLKDDPKVEVAMSLVIAHATSKRAQGQAGVRCYVILDECWSLLEIKLLASEVVQLFRTGRKRDCSVIAVSQSIEDFTGTTTSPNPFGGAILSSTAIKLIGRQKGTYDVLAQYLHLNPTVINKIKGLESTEKGVQSEFLLILGEKADTIASIYVRPIDNEYWLLTTYPREKRYRSWWLKKHDHLPLSQRYTLLTQAFPNGLVNAPELPEEISGEVSGKVPCGVVAPKVAAAAAGACA